MVGRVNSGRRRCSNTGLPWGAPESNPSPKGRAGGAEERNVLAKQRPTVTRFQFDVTGPKRRRDRRSRLILKGGVAPGTPPGLADLCPHQLCSLKSRVKPGEERARCEDAKYRSSAIAASKQVVRMQLGMVPRT